MLTLPKEKSITKSSKSPTSDTPVQYVKGVGPRLGTIFSSRGIHTVRDLLFFFPRSYEDRTQVSKISELQEGLKTTIAIEVVSHRKIPTRVKGRSLFEVRGKDESGTLSLKWFHLPRGMEYKFQVGQQLVVTGTPKKYLGRPEMIHPEITWGKSIALENTPPTDPLHVGRVVPVYVEIEGLTSRLLRRILDEAIRKFAPTLPEDLPPRYVQKYQFPKLAHALHQIHFPTGTDDNGSAIQDLIEFNTPFHQRLIYEEFFKFEFLILKRRLQMEREAAFSIGLRTGRKAVEDIEKKLPFILTRDQKKTIDEILHDLALPQPMNRLIQGDVGSGKTAVALLSSVAALAEGHQAALMAPTEILAEQHFSNAQKLFGELLPIYLLTGRTKESLRNELFEKLSQGEPSLLIGTHALIEDSVIFKNLSLVIIDEQHRFGVEQRRALTQKGVRHEEKTKRTHYPHSLVLSATPIPRTLALTAYGDLAVSTIQEMPPGRSPVLTRVIRGQGRAQAIESVRMELQKGRQAYFIYPLVNESEAEGFQSLRSAVIESEKLQKEVFPEFQVGLLHGQMKSDEKNEVIQKFKSGEYHILVSTTVVEVGVDVPNATVICVEHAERFGLSQLHQLRGRVGRGTHQSYCFYFTHTGGSEVTRERLDVLEKTTDGFEIAEADLRIRGPGEFLGTKQSGELPFKIADLVRDREWLLRARDDAMELLKSDPDLTLSENKPLWNYFQKEGSHQSEILKTS